MNQYSDFPGFDKPPFKDTNSSQLFEIGSTTLGLGDVNRDGEVNLLDVAPFVDALSNGCYTFEADIDQDGFVTLLDVGLFVDLLTN